MAAAPKIPVPMDFFRKVIDQRLPSPITPDTPRRTATGQKEPIRSSKTVKSCT